MRYLRKRGRQWITPACVDLVRSRCRGRCPARRGRGRRQGAGGDLQPPAPHGPAAGPAAGPGAVRDRVRVRRPRLLL